MAKKNTTPMPENQEPPVLEPTMQSVDEAQPIAPTPEVLATETTVGGDKSSPDQDSPEGDQLVASDRPFTDREIAANIAETAMALATALKRMALQPNLAPTPQTRCINCGEQGRVTYSGEQGFHCGACGHTWSVDDEQSPFRRVQRGEM